jgi:hypothetical protein
MASLAVRQQRGQHSGVACGRGRFSHAPPISRLSGGPLQRRLAPQLRSFHFGVMELGLGMSEGAVLETALRPRGCLSR